MQTNATEVNDWIRWATTKRGLGSATVHSYASTYDCLLSWTQEPLGSLGVDQLEEFLARPRKGGGEASPATLKREVASLKTLWRWMHDRNHIRNNPTLQLVTATVHNEAPKPVAREQWIKLWSSDLPDEERAAYGLAFFCGLRREEVCNLHTKQFVRSPRPMLLDVERKGGKRQNIQWASCARLFAQELPELLPQPKVFEDALARLIGLNAGHLLLDGWDGNRDGFFQPDQFNKRLTKRCSIIGMPTVTPHQFRHSFATNLISINVPIPIVARLCGHASIQMTMRYVDTGEDPLSALLKDEKIEVGDELVDVDRWGRR